MNGKIVAGGLAVIALIGGAAMYWLQVYAFYGPVRFDGPPDIRLTPLAEGPPETIIAENFKGIDASSSPLRFRGCFTTPISLATLTETYRIYDRATPLIAPGWFDCFDAEQIGTALQSGEAVAFLSQAGIAQGVDRVVAVFPDGRAYAWHQLSPTPEQ